MKRQVIIITDAEELSPYALVITSKPKKVAEVIAKIKSKEDWCVDDILLALCTKKYVSGILSDFSVYMV